VDCLQITYLAREAIRGLVLYHPIQRTAAGIRLTLLLVGLSALILLPVTARAHTDGIMQLAAEPAGPYSLTVWTSPDPPTTGEPLHVAMAVVLAEDASPVFDADIEVQLTPDDGGPAVSGPATIENSANKFLHEAVLEIEDSGNYQVEIFVKGADGGSGQVSFPLTVVASGINWTLIIVAFLVVGAAVILIARYRRNPALEAGAATQPAEDESAAG